MSKRQQVSMCPQIKATFHGVQFLVGTFGGKVPVGCEQALGAATGRRSKQPMFAVHENLSGRRLLEVLIHEALHACFDRRMSEKDVKQTARDIARFLHRIGVEGPVE